MSKSYGWYGRTIAREFEYMLAVMDYEKKRGILPRQYRPTRDHTEIPDRAWTGDPVKKLSFYVAVTRGVSLTSVESSIQHLFTTNPNKRSDFIPAFADEYRLPLWVVERVYNAHLLKGGLARYVTMTFTDKNEIPFCEFMLIFMSFFDSLSPERQNEFKELMDVLMA